MLRETWRRYWPVDALAIILVVVVIAFASYAEARQHLADERQHQADVRAEKQRAAICAILANIPGHIPPEIAKARGVFARPGHPSDCQPVVHSTPTAHRSPAPTVVLIPAPAATVTQRPSPPATRRPSPTPTPTHSRTPAPSPSPSRSCLLILCR